MVREIRLSRAAKASAVGATRSQIGAREVRPSRQVPFAAKPQMFLGLQLRHPEQEPEHIEFVASRQPGQLGNSFRNDGRGLLRATLACCFIAPRLSPPALMRARPPASAFGQPFNIQCRELSSDTPFKCVTLGGKSQLFRY
jgi:hypothetical protein